MGSTLSEGGMLRITSDFQDSSLAVYGVAVCVKKLCERKHGGTCTGGTARAVCDLPRLYVCAPGRGLVGVFLLLKL